MPLPDHIIITAASYSLLSHFGVLRFCLDLPPHQCGTNGAKWRHRPAVSLRFYGCLPLSPAVSRCCLLMYPAVSCTDRSAMIPHEVSLTITSVPVQPKSIPAPSEARPRSGRGPKRPRHARTPPMGSGALHRAATAAPPPPPRSPPPRRVRTRLEPPSVVMALTVSCNITRLWSPSVAARK